MGCAVDFKRAFESKNKHPNGQQKELRIKHPYKNYVLTCFVR